MAEQYITGFSTINSNKNFKLYDDDLIRQDLMNHFMTKKGERVLRPNFGCDIHKYVFQQDSEQTRSLILLAAKEVFEADPRVAIMSLKTTRIQNGIAIYAELKNVFSGNIFEFINVFNEKSIF